AGQRGRRPGGDGVVRPVLHRHPGAGLLPGAVLEHAPRAAVRPADDGAGVEFSGEPEASGRSPPARRDTPTTMTPTAPPIIDFRRAGIAFAGHPVLRDI